MNVECTTTQHRNREQKLLEDKEKLERNTTVEKAVYHIQSSVNHGVRNKQDLNMLNKVNLIVYMSNFVPYE